jgi:signal transduction histidine kinase
MSIGTLREQRWASLHLAAWWPKLSLAQQFGLVSSVVLLFGMAVIGTWVARRIEDSVVQIAAANSALHIDAFIAPHVQELAHRNTLSDEAITALDNTVSEPSFTLRVRSVKVWRPDGAVVYATNKEVIGREFTPDYALRRAFKGRIATEVDDHNEENEWERSLGARLVEIYAPVRQDGSERIIAVVEFYEYYEALAQDLSMARRQSWLVTGGVGAVLIFALYFIVARGSDTIERQHKALVTRVHQLSDLLRQNEILRARTASKRDSSDLLQRLGSELHDGPAQLLSLALLRLDNVRADPVGQDFTVVQSALQDALNDIRNVCAGLVLPEVRDMSLAEALRHTVEAHERRTGTRVLAKIETLPNAPPEVTAAIARFVQEGLQNAYKHADAEGQCVIAKRTGQWLFLEVSDGGPGIRPADLEAPQGKLGLVGLKYRIEALGGRVVIASRPGKGTRLIMELPVSWEGSDGGQS